LNKVSSIYIFYSILFNFI